LSPSPAFYVTTGAGAFPPFNTWGGAETWQSTPPVIGAGEALFQSDGIYNPATTQTTWNVPYLSNLKVGSLSAITTNTGNLSVTGTVQAGSAFISGTSMGGSGGVLYSGGEFAFGNSSGNISYNGTQLTLNGNVVAVGNLIEGTSTSQSGNTFGFGNGTSVFGIATSGFFKSTNGGTAGLAGISTNSVGIAGNTGTEFSYGALISNTFNGDFITADKVITGLTVASGSFGIFTQRRSAQGVNASVSSPNANTAAYSYLAYLAGNDHYGGRIFTTNTSGVDLRGIVIGGPTYGLTVSGGTAPFTGCHDGLLLKGTTVVAGDIIVDTGVIVATSGVSDTLTEVAVSATANQQGAIGVFAATSTQTPSILQIPKVVPKWEIDEWVDTVEYILNPVYQPIVDTHDYVAINSVGEGQINVCGEGGNFQIGDLIVCSSTAGKGMKQSDDIVRNTTVAKIREVVTFASPTEVKLVSCIYLCG